MGDAKLGILISADTQQAQAGLSNLNTALVKTQTGLQKMPHATNQASVALLNLGRVAQDAPFGIIGIANNLNPLLESFQRTSRAAGGFGATMKALGTSLLGGGGIGLALSVITGALSFFALNSNKAKEATDELAKAKKDAEEKERAFGDALNKSSQYVISQAANLKDLRQILLDTTGAITEVTEATIKQATAAFLFYKKNEQLQKLVNAGIQKELELRKDIRSLPELKAKPVEAKLFTTTDKGTFFVKPLNEDLKVFNKEISDANTELERLGRISHGLEDAFKKLLDPKVTNKKTLPFTDLLNIDTQNLLKLPVEKLTQTLSSDLNTILQRSGSNVDFNLLTEDVNKKIFAQFNEQFRKFGDVAPTIDIEISPVVNVDILQKALDDLTRRFEIAQTVAQGLSNAFGQAFDAAFSGKNAIQALGNAVKQLVIDFQKAAIQAFILKAVTSLFLPGSGAAKAVGGGAGAGALYGRRASGGPVEAGKPYLVGEIGAELFIPRASGTIVPNNSLNNIEGFAQALSVTVVGRISGSDILLSNAREGKNNKRNR